jgi:hypothetical protein
MMVPIFATLLFAVVTAWMGRQAIAIACLIACLLLSIGLFLFEVYSPEYGFRMPWIQTQLDGGAPASPARSRA